MRKTIGILAAALALAACGPDIERRTASTVLHCDLDRHTQKIDWDEELEGDIEFGEAVHAEESGLLRVQVPVRNLSVNTLPCEYKFLFYDARGMELEGLAGAWTPRAVNGRETVNAQGMASKPGARSWRLYVRAAKPIRR